MQILTGVEPCRHCLKNKKCNAVESRPDASNEPSIDTTIDKESRLNDAPLLFLANSSMSRTKSMPTLSAIPFTELYLNPFTKNDRQPDVCDSGRQWTLRTMRVGSPCGCAACGTRRKCPCRNCQNWPEFPEPPFSTGNLGLPSPLSVLCQFLPKPWKSRFGRSFPTSRKEFFKNFQKIPQNGKYPLGKSHLLGYNRDIIKNGAIENSEFSTTPDQPPTLTRSSASKNDTTSVHLHEVCKNRFFGSS